MKRKNFNFVIGAEFFSHDEVFELPKILFPELKTEKEKIEALKSTYPAWEKFKDQLTVERYMTVVEEDDLRQEYTNIEEHEKPDAEKRYLDFKAEAERQIKALKSVVEAYEAQIRDLVTQIRYGMIPVSLNEEKTYLVISNGFRYFYSMVGSELMLVKVQELEDTEKNKWYNQDNNYRDAS